MSGFNDREKALENKFARDAQIDFTVEARTSKIFGLWAAQMLGLSADEALNYAGDVVAANLEEAGFQDIIRKVRKDFDAKGLTVSDHAMETEVQKALVEAERQLKG